MRILLTSCTLLFLFSRSLAQAPRPTSALMMQQPISQNCPVFLHADRVPGGVLSRAADSKIPRGVPLHVSFKPTEANGIVQADFVLHGQSGTHVMPAGSQAGAGTTEAFSVTPKKAGEDVFESVVYVRKLTAVGYLELTSIRYADGAVWHASANSTCRVTPDGFMLVAAGR